MNRETKDYKLVSLYPPQDQLLDTKPETIYQFDELEQQAVLSLCKYLCVSNGHYWHKILPLILRYLATLHLAKWPPHYFKNLFLLKYQQSNNQNMEEQANNISIIEEEEEEQVQHTEVLGTDHNLNDIPEEPQKIKSRNTEELEQSNDAMTPTLNAQKASNKTRESDEDNMSEQVCFCHHYPCTLTLCEHNNKTKRI